MGTKQITGMGATRHDFVVDLASGPYLYSVDLYSVLAVSIIALFWRHM